MFIKNIKFFIIYLEVEVCKIYLNVSKYTSLMEYSGFYYKFFGTKKLQKDT